jgi:hypothetical protein
MIPKACRRVAELHFLVAARFPWYEVRRVEHYWLEVDALRQPMQVREPEEPYGGTAT